MSDGERIDGTREIIARTAQIYDRVQYDSKPFPHSQPSRMAGLADYFGLATAPLAGARVLELGGASGGNLIPHALRYPDARFTVVDISRVQIAAGQARVERLGLTNIALRCESVTDIDERWGEFDYIICHGVYSWVPPPIQDAILRVIRARLSPLGIACVSYNVLPGWRMYQPFRDALMLKVPDQNEPAARLAAARDLLDFVRSRTSDPGPYGDILRSWGEKLADAPDYYLAHEYLEDVNLPTTIRDFVAAAATHRLGYLCDCDISAMMADNFGPEVVDYVQARARDDMVETEQYLDILSGRTFRQSLLIAAERLVEVRRDIGPERLANRHLVARGGLALEQDGDYWTVRDPAGAWVRTASAAAAEGVARLIERHPASSTIDDCAAAITGDPIAGRRLLADTLHNMLTAYIITISAEPITPVIPGDRSKAIALARADASDGALVTTNIRHELVALDPIMRALLPAMDGTLDREGLARRLEGQALSGKLVFMRDGQPIADAAGVRLMAEAQVAETLAAMAKIAILEDRRL